MKYLIGAAFALLFACSANAATINLCTGAADQPYAQAGEMIKDEARGSDLDINVVKDTGGTWGNIKLSLAGKCEALIGQPDGMAYLARTEPGFGQEVRTDRRSVPRISACPVLQGIWCR